MLYVFGREEVRLEECVEAFKTFFPDRLSHVIILYDTIYHHCIGIHTYVSSLPYIHDMYLQLSLEELKERLNDYTNLVPSLLSLPHPITPSHITTITPSHTTCSNCTTDQHSQGSDNVESAISEQFVSQ